MSGIRGTAGTMVLILLASCPLPAQAPHEDLRFNVTMAALITAAGSDLGVSMYQIGRGNMREVGFGAWWQDKPVTFALSKSAMTALLAYQLHRLHRTRPKTALVIGIIVTGVEAGLVARAASMHPR